MRPLRFFVVVAVAGLSTSLTAAYYVDPTEGSDSGPGTSGSPWRTVEHAEAAAAPCSTVFLQSGDYGDVVIDRPDGARAGWSEGIYFKAADGAEPVFRRLYFVGTQARYLSFTGMDITVTAQINPVAIGGSCIRIIDCDVTGYWAGTDVSQVSGELVRIHGEFGAAGTLRDITIRGCDLRNGYCGINAGGSYTTLADSIILRENQIHHLIGAGITLHPGGIHTVLVEGNHIFDCFRGTISGGATHGSGIAIWGAGGVTVRGNIIRDCGSTALCRTYPDGSPVFHDLLIENNLGYDGMNGDQSFELNQLGNNIVIRNNTIIGHDARYTELPKIYSTALKLRPAGGYDGSRIRLYNNILVGPLNITAGIRGNMDEGNNIMWSCAVDNFFVNEISSSSNSFVVCYQDASYRYYYNSGFTADYFAGTGNFFKGNAVFDDVSFSYPDDGPHGIDLADAYMPADESPAVGFGAASEAPATDISGMVRDGSPDAGCYEWITTVIRPVVDDVGRLTTDRTFGMDNGSRLLYRFDGRRLSSFNAAPGIYLKQVDGILIKELVLP